MQRRLFVIAVCLLAASSFSVGGTGSASIPLPEEESNGRIVVANRAAGTISVIDSSTDAVIGTHALPAGPNQPEPMYVVQSNRRIFVGDRANSRVAVFDSRDFALEGTVPTGAGVWHMWADRQGHQLWVANDIDKNATVIDPVSLAVLATVPMPADLVALGGKPHDVILDPRRGAFAFVSLVTVSGPNDFVVKFSTSTFEEVDRAPVGKDPHLSATQHNDVLYVPCQNSNAVFVLDRGTLEEVTESPIPVPGAHGAGMAPNGRTFYTSNLPGGGPAGLITIDTRTNSVVGGAVDTPFPGPHNIALTPNGRKLYVTHSGGASDKVTVYERSGNDQVPSLVGEVTVGLNPFGLAYVQ